MPTNVLSLGQTESNYDDLDPAIKADLADPKLLNSGSALWQLKTLGGRNKLTVEDLVVDNFHDGKVRIVKASFDDLDFRIGTASAVETTNATFRNSEFTAEGPGEPPAPTDQSDSVVFGAQTKLTNVDVELGDGNDYLGFKATAQSTNGEFNLGDGADTVVFDANSKVGATNHVDLGDDGSGGPGDGDNDLVIVKKNAQAQGLTIKNVEAGDSLVIGGQTYTGIVADTTIGGITIDTVN